MGTDLELMLRVTRGDEGAFGELLGRHRAPLTNYFRRMLHDPASAEDLAQETFLRVYQARDRYHPEAQFTTWLYRIATNLALNAIRDRRGEAPLPASDAAEDGAASDRMADVRPNVEQQLIESDREHVIRRAVEELPERQRAAVILHKYQDVDYREIGKVLGVSESAVKSLLFRAYESLRTRLEPLLVGGKL